MLVCIRQINCTCMSRERCNADVIEQKLEDIIAERLQCNAGRDSAVLVYII
jgi:hypothetical protein